VLLDIQLPGINGVQTFAQLRRLPGWAQVPVIALTASVMRNERSTLVTEGFDAFLAKPLSVKELVRLVRQTLDSAP
jgi:CheY-like chemotaxis protein